MFLVLEMMVLIVSWTFGRFLVGERVCIQLKSLVLVGCFGSAHWDAWPAVEGWQEVQPR